MDNLKEKFSKLFTEDHMNGVKDTFLAFSGLLFGIFVVILFVFIGWFIVWKMFLSRFPLIKELVYGSGDEGKHKKLASNEPLRRSVRIREKSTGSDHQD